MNAPHTRILSASGSRLRPTSVSGPYRRAHQPSSQSVTHAKQKIISPQSQASLAMQAKRMMARGIRTNESRLGMLRSGSGGLEPDSIARFSQDGPTYSAI